MSHKCAKSHLVKSRDGRKRNKRIEAKKEGLRIGAWNVRKDKDFDFEGNGTLWQVTSEMKRYGLNILGISEKHWKRQGDIVSDDMKDGALGRREVQTRSCNTI